MSPAPHSPPAGSPWRRQGGQGRIDNITGKGLGTAVALSTASCSFLLCCLPAPEEEDGGLQDAKTTCCVCNRNVHRGCLFEVAITNAGTSDAMMQ